MSLKFIVSAVLISGFLLSCAPTIKTMQPARPQKIELTPNDRDSTEYDLVIIDAGFQSWFDLNRKPIWYYTEDYLAIWNRQYVIAWNEKVRDPLSIQRNADNPFMLEIDYRPTIDYGIDLNYKLYHYFKYVEETWGKILPYDRHN